MKELKENINLIKELKGENKNLRLYVSTIQEYLQKLKK